MSKETCGAHLRNLLSPYSNLLQIFKNRTYDSPTFALMREDFTENFENNLQELKDFSHSDTMEKVGWRESEKKEFRDKMSEFIAKRAHNGKKRWTAVEVETFCNLCVNLAMNWADPLSTQIIEDYFKDA